MESYFGMKELYQLAIKATNRMVIGARIIEAGEPILYLKDVKLSSLTQSAQPRVSRGGKGNLPHIIWEDQDDIILRVTEGTITPIGLALLTNTRMLQNPNSGQLIIPKTEFLTLDDAGKVKLKFTPNINYPVFIFSYKNNVIQSRITNVTITEDEIDCGSANAYQDISIEYSFNYGDDAKVYLLDNSRFNELVTVEGRYYTQDTDGIRKTNLLSIPKAKIISNLSVRIGEMSDPTISVFQIRALSTSTDVSEKCVMSITELDSDIDGDF